MVLESFINPLKAEEHPKRMFFYGLLYATIGIFLSQWIFYDYASLVMVFFTTFAAVPLIYNIIKFEEKKDLKNLNEKNLLKEHSKALKVFMFYFFGTTIAFAFWYIILKPETISSIFST